MPVEKDKKSITKKAQKYYDKAERYQTKIDSISVKNHSSRKVNKLEKKKKKALRDAEIKKKGKLTNKEKAMIVGAIGTKNNCRRCTFAYEMSRRGYDVKATKSVSGTGQNTIGLNSAISKETGYSGYFRDVFKKGTYADKIVTTTINQMGLKDIPLSSNSKDNAKNIFKSLSEYPNGARGEIMMRWNVGGGHSMAFEIVKGKPIIFDCQSKVKYSSFEDFSQMGEYILNASSTRLDDIDLNEDFLMRWLKNAS